MLSQLWSWALAELGKPLIIFGFVGQFVFFMRFAVQWFASERRGKSHIPISFWYLSIVGGAMTLAYAILKQDLVFTVAQALGLLIYTRNLMLIAKRRARIAERRRAFLVDTDLAPEAEEAGSQV